MSMVLRSAYLPIEIEEKLRAVAFYLRKPKSDVLRYCISQGLHQLLVDLNNSPNPEKFPLPVSETEKAAREADMHRLIAATGGDS